MSHKIEIACDTEDGEFFAAYLTAQGHKAVIGRSTGSFVDGFENAEGSVIINRLWEDFCNY